VSLLVVSLVVYSSLTTPAPPEPSRGGAFGAPTDAPTATASVSGGLFPTTTPSGSQAPSPAAAPSASTAPAPRGGGGSARTPALPTAGSYGVRVEGTEGVKLGGVGFCNRPLPDRTTLYVKDGYEGRDSPTSFEFDIAYSANHSERHIYRYTNEGVFLNYEFAQVRCGPRAQDTELVYSRPQEKVRLPLKVGETWSGRGGDAQRTETYTSRVLRTEILTIAGRRVSTFVIETSIEMTGSEHGSRLQRWWYSPSLALPVRTYEEYDAASGPGSYQARLTVTLEDLDPS
jgi:hypothetical protein